MYKVYVDSHRRFAVELDENPRYRRLLCLSDSGIIDVVKVKPEKFKFVGWKPFEQAHSSFMFANTFAKSTLLKTDSAARAMEQIMNEAQQTMSAAELLIEYNRLAVAADKKPIKGFESKAAAVKAISKLTAFKNVAQPDPVAATVIEPNGVGAVEVDNEISSDHPKDSVMVKKAKVSKKSSPKKSAPAPTKGPKVRAAKSSKAKGPSISLLDRAKKIAQMEKGIGGLIVKLLKSGKDKEAVLSQVFTKFPDSKANVHHITWYRSMLVKAGAVKA